jgi:hypothetical protein
MKAIVLLALLSVGVSSYGNTPVQTPERPSEKPRLVAPAENSQVSVKATIVKIDVSAGLIVLKDGKGKIWEFTVDPKSGIDLTQYAVGDVVTATFSVPPASGDKTPRARISKQELIKLQKK